MKESSPVALLSLLFLFLWTGLGWACRYGGLHDVAEKTSSKKNEARESLEW